MPAADEFRMQQRRSTAAVWAHTNPILLSGEFGVEKDTGKFKVGNGTDTWNALPYAPDRGAAGPQGPTGPQGPQGLRGPDGLSAYEVAVSNGFVGTEAQWLASLKGADGLDGTDGTNGAQGPQGPQGPQGIAGVGVPPGGNTGQLLSKNSANDYDLVWATVSASVPDGSVTLAKLASDFSLPPAKVSGTALTTSSVGSTVAALDANGRVPVSQLPPSVIGSSLIADLLLATGTVGTGDITPGGFVWPGGTVVQWAVHCDTAPVGGTSVFELTREDNGAVLISGTVAAGAANTTGKVNVNIPEGTRCRIKYGASSTATTAPAGVSIAFFNREVPVVGGTISTYPTLSYTTGLQHKLGPAEQPGTDGVAPLTLTDGSSNGRSMSANNGGHLYDIDGFAADRPSFFGADGSVRGFRSTTDYTAGLSAMTIVCGFQMSTTDLLPDMILYGRVLGIQLQTVLIGSEIRLRGGISLNGTSWAVLLDGGLAITRGTKYVGTLVYGGGTLSLRLNKQASGSANVSGAIGANNHHLAYGVESDGQSRPFRGNLGPAIAYNSALSGANLTAAEDYIAATLGIVI